MGDKKPKLSADEAKAKLASAKEKLIEAKDALASFCKENKLKKSEDHSTNEDAKIAKGWKKRKDAVDEQQARVEKYQGIYKEAKKSGKGIKAKYTYPKDVKTSEDKKKYRAEIRGKAKRAGCTVEEFLADPEKYEKILKAKSEKSESSKKKKEEPKKKKKKEKPAKEEETEEEDEATESDEAEEESDEASDAGEEEGEDED